MNNVCLQQTIMDENIKYPDGFSKAQKRIFRKRPAKFSIINGFLVYKDSRRWVINKNDQQKILESCHSDKLPGHFGRDKTRRMKI